VTVIVSLHVATGAAAGAAARSRTVAILPLADWVAGGGGWIGRDYVVGV
jgi:hypothetical protein